MDKKLKLINAIKAGKIKNKKDLESFIIDDLKKTEIVNEVVAELPKIKSIKGEPGKDGEDGENGKTPTKKELIDLIKPLIPAPINGVDGISPTVDTDSIVTRATKLASDALKPLIPTSTQVAELLPERGDLVRNSLELLQGDERLSAEAIKGLPELTKEVSDYKVNAPSRGIFTYVGGAKKGLINTIDFIGVTHSKVNGRDTLTTTTPDLSGYLKLNQTTPQTTVGNFSFPSVSVTAGNMNQYSPMLFGDFSNTTGYIPIWNDGVGGFDSDSGLYYSTALREFQTPSIYASDGVSGVYLNDGTYAINATGKSYLNGAVTLGAGSATAGTAPLKFTSGTLTTVAVAGQLEYLSNRFYIRGTDKLTIGGNSGTYQLEIKDSDTATGGILVNTSTYVNIPNPGSVTEKAIFNARGFGFCVDTYTLGATFQPSLGIGLAGNRGPMLGIKASATGAAIAIEQGRIGVGTSGPQEPIDCIGNILTRSTSGTAYETRTRMVSTYYGGASNYASGGIEIDGVQAGVGYGLYGATRFYAGANTDATRGWAWKANGLLGVTTLAASGAQMVLNKSGNLVIGGVAASARLHLISTTEQLRVGYDATNYFSVTVGSTGSVTTALTGTSPINIFSQAIRGNGGFQSSDGTAGIAGTKVYYVSDSSGGTVNRKLTFKDGILTAET